MSSNTNSLSTSSKDVSELETMRGIEIKSRFICNKSLGQGSFGQVYAGTDKKNGNKIAVKIATGNSIKNLQHEAKLYHHLNKDQNRQFGVPHLLWAGMDNDKYVVVIDQLGLSLNDLVSRAQNKCFSLKTTILIAIQGLYLLEYIHSFGIIHRDLKPANFLMGMGKHDSRLYLIDFGLAKYYIDLETGKHINYIEGKNLTGTAKYVSIFTHLGIEQSRRDDLESFGYVLLQLLLGRLPWQHIVNSNKKERYRLIGIKKQKTSLSELCYKVPGEFKIYFEYCRNLGFTEDPDYQFLRSLFIKLANKEKYKIDGIYDWSS